MIKVKIKKSSLIWDQWNIKHIERHNVTKAEIEEIFTRLVIVRQSYKSRIIAFGKTKTKRLLVVVLEKEKKGYYVLTSRDVSRKERRSL